MTTTTSRIYRYECWDIQFVPHIRFQTVTLYSQTALQTEFRSKDHTRGVQGAYPSRFFSIRISSGLAQSYSWEMISVWENFYD